MEPPPPPPPDFTSIPVLDLSLAADPSTCPQLLAQLRHALTDVGFLYVSNHGVDPRVVEDLRAALPRLFALPRPAKEEVALGNSPHFLGYSAEGTEVTAGERDHREQFEFANELEEAWVPGDPLCERLRGPNQWPSAYPELRAIVEAYIAELTALGERFLHLVARALSLPPETFLPFLSDQHRLKLVHYPASATAAQGVGPHKDSSGWWTFLLQASPPDVRGLQILSRSGTWVDAPNLPGTFVVNIGQAFEAVTRGACRATTHRVVVLPAAAGGGRGRFSVPFFQGVRRDLRRGQAVGVRLTRGGGIESPGAAGDDVDSPFLTGAYETWGESQLRTKIRSHKDVGRRFYGDVYEKYVNDDT